MKRLFVHSLNEVTILDRRNQPYHLPPDSKIALKSCSFKVKYSSTFLTLLNVNTSWSIDIRGGIKTDVTKVTEQIRFDAGTYTLPDLVTEINNNSSIVGLDILRNGNIKLSIKDGLKPSINEFWLVLGIGISKGSWAGPGNLFGRPKIEDPTRLELVCEEVDSYNSNYVDGEPSNIMQYFPLLNHEKSIKEYFEHPVFIPVIGSTDTLHFRFESEKNKIKVTDITLEILLQ